jgi:hypothetical protein
MGRQGDGSGADIRCCEYVERLARKGRPDQAGLRKCAVRLRAVSQARRGAGALMPRILACTDYSDWTFRGKLAQAMTTNEEPG